MFDRSEETSRQAEAIYRITDRLGRGDVLTYQAVAEVFEDLPQTKSWYRMMDKIRRRLQQERGIATWAEVGVGIRLLTERQTIEDLPRWRQLRARRQVRRGLTSVIQLPVESLTPHQQKTRSLRIEQFRRIDRDIASEIKLTAVLTRKVAGPPRVRPVRP